MRGKSGMNEPNCSSFASGFEVLTFGTSNGLAHALAVLNNRVTDLMGWKTMIVGTKFGLLFVALLALSACNSPEELARKNAEFQKKNFVGTNAAGKSIYTRKVFADRVPRRENIFFAAHR